MNNNGLNAGAACKQCGAVLEEVDALLSAGAAREATIRALKAELAEKRDKHKYRKEAEEVHAHWKQMCRPRARTFSPADFDAVAARLNEDISKFDLMWAVDGAAEMPYVVNGRRCRLGSPQERHDKLRLICRDEEKVRDFQRLAPTVDVLLERARNRLALLPLDGAVVERQTFLRRHVFDFFQEHETLEWALQAVAA